MTAPVAFAPGRGLRLVRELRRGQGQQAHDDIVADLVVVGPDRLVSAGYDGDVVLWDTTAGVPIWVARWVATSSSIAPLVRLDAVVVGTKDGELLTVDLGAGSVRTIAHVDSEVVAVAAVGENIVAGGRSGRGLAGRWRSAPPHRTFRM